MSGRSSAVPEALSAAAKQHEAGHPALITVAADLDEAIHRAAAGSDPKYGLGQLPDVAGDTRRFAAAASDLGMFLDWVASNFAAADGSPPTREVDLLAAELTDFVPVGTEAATPFGTMRRDGHGVTWLRAADGQWYRLDEPLYGADQAGFVDRKVETGTGQFDRHINWLAGTMRLFAMDAGDNFQAAPIDEYQRMLFLNPAGTDALVSEDPLPEGPFAHGSEDPGTPRLPVPIVPPDPPERPADPIAAATAGGLTTMTTLTKAVNGDGRLFNYRADFESAPGGQRRAVIQLYTIEHNGSGQANVSTHWVEGLDEEGRLRWTKPGAVRPYSQVRGPCTKDAPDQRTPDEPAAVDRAPMP